MTKHSHIETESTKTHRFW